MQDGNPKAVGFEKKSESHVQNLEFRPSRVRPRDPCSPNAPSRFTHRSVRALGKERERAGGWRTESNRVRARCGDASRDAREITENQPEIARNSPEMNDREMSGSQPPMIL